VAHRSINRGVTQKPTGAAYRRLKASREENLTKYTGSTSAYFKESRNKRKSFEEKGGEKQKKQDP